jgi:hypothetical protein
MGLPSALPVVDVPGVPGMKEIIEGLKITVELPEHVLRNLDRAGYLNNYTSYHTDLTIRSYGSRDTLNKTIADMIIEKWGYKS